MSRRQGKESRDFGDHIDTDVKYSSGGTEWARRIISVLIRPGAIFQSFGWSVLSQRWRDGLTRWMDEGLVLLTDDAEILKSGEKWGDISSTKLGGRG